jgi:hypothetical protein
MKRSLLVLIAILTLVVSAAGQETAIPKGSKLYIEPSTGFETYLAAAILNKHVSLVVVMDKSAADFLVSTTSQQGEKPTFAQTWVFGKMKRDEDASVQIVNGRTREIVWAYSVHKYNAAHGMQSAAEAVAKHLKNWMEGKEGTVPGAPLQSWAEKLNQNQ